MHDPTEGGLATGLWELSEAAEVGFVIDRDAIPVLPETEAVCARLGLDPLGLIASGALLLAVASKDASAIISALGKSGIQAAQVGHVVERQNGVYLYTAKGKCPLPRFSRDEIAQLYE